MVTFPTWLRSANYVGVVKCVASCSFAEFSNMNLRSWNNATLSHDFSGTAFHKNELLFSKDKSPPMCYKWLKSNFSNFPWSVHQFVISSEDIPRVQYKGSILQQNPKQEHYKGCVCGRVCACVCVVSNINFSKQSWHSCITALKFYFV